MCGRVKGQGREKVRQGDEVAIVVDFTVPSRAKRGEGEGEGERERERGSRSRV